SPIPFLTEEWLDLVRSEMATVESEMSPGFTAMVEFVVPKGPGGEVRWVGAFENGSLVSATMGAGPDADVSLTTVYPDAVAVLRGELDLNTAFMQGRMKVAGPTGPLLALIAQAQAPATRAALDGVLAATSF
ncbi:MAG: SCP2 sterol-binding domain-containing protein, partial [Aquihabitans sp.]